MAISSMVLLPKMATSGRVAAYEFLLTTPAICNLIRENKTYRIDSSIQTGKKYGMQLLDEAIMDLYNKGWITGDAAYQKANDKAKFRPLLREPPSDFTEA